MSEALGSKHKALELELSEGQDAVEIGAAVCLCYGLMMVDGIDTVEAGRFANLRKAFFEICWCRTSQASE